MRLWSLVRHRTDRAPSSQLPYLGLDQLESGTGRLAEGSELQPQDDPQALLCQPGDVLFGKLRPYLHKVHNVDDVLVCSGELMVLRPNSQVSGRYLYYVALSDLFVGWATATSYGVKMPRTNWDALRELRVSLPSLDEQRRVADYLDSETGRIDALIAAKRRLREVVSERATALVDAAISRGLDAVADLNETGITGVGPIPTHWAIAPLARLVDPYRPIRYGIVLPGPNVDDGVPIIKSGDVRPGRLAPGLLDRTTHEIESGYIKSRVFPGDIVYSIRGSVGDAEIVPGELHMANLTQDAARIAPRDGLDPRWLLHALRSRRLFAQLESGMTGAAVKGVNIGALRKLRVPLPPLEEQHAIAVFLDRETAVMGQITSAASRQIDLLNEFRQALITSTVTGEIPLPPEWAGDEWKKVAS